MFYRVLTSPKKEGGQHGGVLTPPENGEGQYGGVLTPPENGEGQYGSFCNWLIYNASI